MKALLGTKIGMTQLISEDGKAVPVTLIQAGPVTVTQVKTVDTDGYNAVQVGFEMGKNLSKAVAGHTKTAKVSPKFIREFRVEDMALQAMPCKAQGVPPCDGISDTISTAGGGHGPASHKGASWR